MTTQIQPGGAPVRSLSDQAAFLIIHFERFGNYRKVASERIEVEADKTMVTVTKRLLTSEELQAIFRLDRDVMDYIAQTGLPYDNTIHIIPYAVIERVEGKLREFAAKRAELVEIFVERFPELRREAEKPLGILYNPGDYETPEQVRREFSIRWQYVALAVPGKLEQISPGMFAEERAKVRDRMQDVLNNITQLLSAGLLELLNRLRASLEPGPDGKKKRLTTPAVENLKEFLDTLPFRNITGNAELNQLAGQIGAILGGVDVGMLRDTDNLKDRVRTAIVDVTAKLQKMVETAGPRKFRLDEAD